eukprot:27382-Chlamydomonas_euryale.AAC.1
MGYGQEAVPTGLLAASVHLHTCWDARAFAHMLGCTCELAYPRRWCATGRGVGLQGRCESLRRGEAV